MTDSGPSKRVVISTDKVTLASSVARRFLSRVARRTEAGKLAHISLTGGSMGTAVLAAAAALPRAREIDWTRVHFWWSDERFVPRGHTDRNDLPPHAEFFDVVGVPAANIHAAAGSDEEIDLDEAADRYARELAEFADGDQPWPSFDVCFLGVGPDGHVASLFPDRPEIQIVDRAVVAVRDSPKPPPERVSMTRPVINSSKRVWLVLAGADKAAALGLALAGASYESVPAAGAKGTKRTIFFVDEAAAAEVPPDLIEREY